MADQEDSHDPHEDHGQVVLSPSSCLVIDRSLALTLASAILPQFDVFVDLKCIENGGPFEYPFVICILSVDCEISSTQIVSFLCLQH